MSDIVNSALKRSIISQMLNEATTEKSVPVISLGSKDGSVDVDVKLKFSDEPDKEIIGKIQLSTEDYKKLLEGKAKLQSYTFIIESAGEKKTIILSGDEVNEGGFVHLVMGKPYTIIEIKEGGDTEKGGEGNNPYRGGDIDEANTILKDLKGETETFKTISQYKDDPEFQRIFLDSFIEANKSIKINNEKLGVTLKKMRSAGLLEEPGMSGLKRKYLNLKLSLQKFMNNLFKLFGKLHKNGRESNLYKIIKQFYKDLFFIVRQGSANISDEKTRKMLWKKLLGSFSNVLSGLKKSSEFIKSKYKGTGKETNESIIVEAEGDKKVIFTQIGVTEDDIDNSAEDFADENNLDEENPDVEIDPEEIKRLGFLYYGRGANFLLQNTSIFKWRDITNIVGLGKGGFEKKTDKMKEKYGIYGSLTDKDFSMDMGADSYNIVFSDDLTYRKDGKEIIRLYKGKEYKFNYFKDKKSIAHRTSKQDKYPEVTIYIRMSEDPKVAGENEQPKEYVENVLEIRPSKGSVFEIKPGDLKTKFKVVGTNIENKK